MLAIRKHQAQNLTLEDYVAGGAFDAEGLSISRDSVASELERLHDERDYAQLLRHAIENRQNILVSGGTSTGKTTFVNMLLREIPSTERIILIEDAPELKLTHRNAIGLVAARSSLGEAELTTEDLLNASLRMRPDRIILGELRGPEAYSFLRAINTGHPGSMTTIHADSPVRAIDQIALLVLQTGVRLTNENIVRYIRSTVDLFVQLDRVGGKRRIIEIATSKSLDIRPPS